MPGEMVPIILFIVMGVVGLPVGLAYSPIGSALARRFSGGRDKALEEEVEALRAEVEALRGELDSQRSQIAGQIEEVNGRVDFAERLIAQQRPRDALPAQASGLRPE